MRGLPLLFSAPFTGDLNEDFTLEQLKDKNIFIGYGDYDFVMTRSLYHRAADEDGNPFSNKNPADRAGNNT